MKKIVSIVLSFALLFTLFGCSNSKYTKFSKSFLNLFDTASSITAYDTSQAEFNKKYNKLYSVIKGYSELYDIYNDYDNIVNLKYINDNAYKKPIKVDKRIIELLTYGKKAYKITNGYVNLAMGSVLSIWHDYREKGESLPPKSMLTKASEHTDINNLIIDKENSTIFFNDKELKLDVGAITKGFVCNKIYEYITQNNIWQSAVISLGGNIITIGNKPDKNDFVIGIENPNSNEYLDKIYADDKLVDTYTTRFGIRSIEYIADKGFYLNGKHRKFQGVCNHHDLGPLGAAINVAALRHQLTLLKDMGCDAIRTSHNMPTPELVALCDEMGFMMMIEPFDEWDIAKCENGYHRYFNEWAERDMVNMLHNYRNNPCVIMWSIGNEVPTQCSPVGYKVAKFLQDICHREDPTRPVTCGMDQVTCVLANGFAAMIDIPGLNYRTQRYKESYDQLPQNLILGSETASTVSSRGVYKFPVEDKKSAKYEDHQCSSYDVEACSWSNIPDEDFALADDNHWTIGQFVWTGFDYLGEPSPYDTDAWPNHSSMFGIIDLASLPKDRYYLYRSVWNKDAETLHILPHWTWPGREGEVTPVFVYTNYPTAELFINGKSYGKQSKNNSSLKNRYRLMWMDAVYEPGEVKVVAYNKDGKAVAEKVVRTAGKPHHIELVSNRNELTADGKDLAYVTVKVVDKDGNLCPTDNRQINFSAKGAGKYRAAANGDPTNLEQFHLPKMHAFNGMLTAIIQAGETAGEIVFTAKANGVKAGNIRIQTK